MRFVWCLFLHDGFVCPFAIVTQRSAFFLYYCLSNTKHTTVSPRAYLPVQLIEGRIAKDLCANLMAIRKYVTKMELKRGVSSWL